jgi:NADH-quinone oxidoreductase subunit M
VSDVNAVTDVPLLTVLIVLPILTALVVALVPAERADTIRGVGLAGTVVTFVVSLGLLAGFDAADTGFQFTETVPWIAEWGIDYRLGVDGISLFLVLLTTLVSSLAVLATWGHVNDRVKSFYLSVLTLEASMIGVFVALDMILFYMFFEVMLVPMYILIGVWGGANRRYAAIKFFLYTFLGGLFMLVGILYLYFSGGAESFAYEALRQVELTFTEQIWLFIAFFAAFGVKVPIFPLHTWLPDAHTEAPTLGSVDLAAVMLKIGGYGLIRFALPFFPLATERLAPAIIVLAIIGVLYGALVAIAQSDLKKLVAYSSVAHMGFVVLGIFALDTISTSASVMQMVNHGLATGALFILIGYMYDRTHSRAIADYSGIMKATPVFGGVFLVVVMSSIALPGLNGFVGEFPILLGAYQSYVWAGVAATLGVVLAALYLLWPYQRMFHGPVEGRAVGLVDLNLREIAAVVPILVLLVGIGLYPKPIYDRITPSVEAVLTEVDQAVADAEDSTETARTRAAPARAAPARAALGEESR